MPSAVSASFGPAVFSSKERALRVLFVEDSEADTILLTRALQRGGFDVISQRVQTAEHLTEALKAKAWDFILADHSMPGFSAPEALTIVKQHGLDVPFIIVSGHIEEETAVAAMQAGAHDYIMKDELARLVPAVERELREAAVRRAERQYAEELRQAREELEQRVDERTADLKDANKKLQQVLEERGQLETELLEIAENERRRIGFDLHDDLGQKLTGASLMVKGLEHKLAAQKHPSAADAARIQALLAEIVNHTHDLAHQFSSLDAQGEDLCAVLQRLSANVKKVFNVTCNFTTNGTAPELPTNSTLQLHKIAQEAVSNAIKHGKTKKVSITLDCEGGDVVLTIRNDGLPFAVPAGSKGRMGLRIMNYRANTVGATLEIKPQSTGGTIVTCKLPVKNGGNGGFPHRRRVNPASKAEAVHAAERMK